MSKEAADTAIGLTSDEARRRLAAYRAEFRSGCGPESDPSTLEKAMGAGFVEASSLWAIRSY
jgi:hypothetical protein